LKNGKIPASKAVGRFLSKIGKKGGSAGKGSRRVIEKMRKATEIRLAKQKAKLEEQKKKKMSTTLTEDELFKLKQRHLTQSQRALIAAELATGF
jgi:hypothetical protein